MSQHYSKLFGLVLGLLIGYASLAPIQSNSAPSSGRFSINELESSQYHPKNGSFLHRGATYTKVQRFKNGIVPYSFSGAHNPSEQAIIVSAMATFSEKTGNCIKWVPRTTEEDFVTVVKEGGCAAGFRRLYLEPVCYNGPQATSYLHHEMMHEIGFQHEQQRTDQDDHIIILWDNIKEEGKQWYKKQEADNQNIPYDINSIMHYDPWDFAIDASKPTMVAKNGKPVGPGQGGLMTKLDIMKIRNFYDCDKQSETVASSGNRFTDGDKTLQISYAFFPGQKLSSPNGKIELQLTKKGNLVLTNTVTDEMLFQSETKDASRAEMQKDGNFVVYDQNTQSLWATGTDNFPDASQVAVQDDGAFVVQDKAGQTVWSSTGERDAEYVENDI